MSKAEKSSSGAEKSAKRGKDTNALTQILNGEFLTKSFVLNNLPYIFFIILLLIVFVAKGYYVKQLNDEIKINEAELNQNAADFIEAKSKLEEETKRYKLLEKLEDRQLKESLNATKVIRIKKQ
jgi:hypothetical protein